MATEIRGLTQPSTAMPQPLTPDIVPSDRESAYYHWAWVADRNATETARALGLSPRTVQDWVSRDGWKTRYDQERGELAVRVRASVEVALLRAFPEVVQGFLKIFRGEGDSRQTLDKEGNLVTVYDAVPYQARVNAGKELVSLLGGPTTHHHHHTADTTAPTSTPPALTDHGTATMPMPHLTREQVAALTPEQRRQLEQQIRSRM